MSVLNTETAPERNGMLAPTAADDVSSVQLANSFLRTALDQTTEGIMVVEPYLAHCFGPRILLHNTRMAALVGAEPQQGLRDRFLTQLVATSEEADDLLRAIRMATSQGGAAQWEGGLKTLYGHGRQRCTWRIRAVMDEHARVYNYTLAVVPSHASAAPPSAMPLAIAPDDPRRLRNDNIAELTPGILHDINHILAIMTTNLSAAISLLPSHIDALKHVEEALAAAHKASEFTTQALRMAKDLPECIEPTDMLALIRSTARIAQSGSGVNLHLSLPTDLWWAVVDSARISQVLQNLVLNGIQAMNHHGNMDVFARNVVVPPGHTSLLPGPYVEVVVRDRGCGMEPSDAERALHIPFTNKPGGNGIGLTTCRRIISDHHGHIVISSMKNVGTEVIFWLPATQPLESKAPPPPSGEALKGLGTVLVVDDEKCLRGVVTLVLRRLGYRVFEAESGEEAIVSYRHLMRSTGEVDLVIMDLTLPGGLSGEEALQQIRALNPHAKVIASSGGLIKEHRPIFISKGFCDILPKPYEVNDIAEVAHRVLHRQAVPKAA